MGKNTALIISGIAAIILLPKILNKDTEDNLFGMPSIDLSGLLSGSILGGGDNPLSGLAGLGGGLFNTPDLTGIFDRIKDTLAGIPLPQIGETGGAGVTGGRGQNWLTGSENPIAAVIDAATRNIVGTGEASKNVFEGLGTGARGVGQGTVMVAGSVIAGRFLAPIAVRTGQAVAPLIARGTATIVGSLAAPFGLTLGTAFAVPAFAAAGYYAGTQFNKTKAGQSLLDKSGSLGAKFAYSNIGAKMYGYATLSERTKAIMNSPAYKQRMLLLKG